jgi:threonine/homoserine/homoserine lactone efflux protein
MSISIIHVVAGLLALVAFVLAIMAAGAGLVSGLFMLAGFAALAWLAYSLIRGVLRRRASA